MKQNLQAEAEGEAQLNGRRSSKKPNLNEAAGDKRKLNNDVNRKCKV